MQSHAGALDAREHLGVERVQVAHVVVDLAQPVFARHPGGADLAFTRWYRHVLQQVEARQRLWRDEQPRAVRQGLEVPQKPARQLPVSWAYEPAFRPPARRVPECEVAGGAGHRQVMFLQAPPPIRVPTLTFTPASPTPHPALSLPRSPRSHAAPPRT